MDSWSHMQCCKVTKVFGNIYLLCVLCHYSIADMIFLVPWLDLTVLCPPHIIIRGNIFKAETIRHLVT